jgi:hypothetical protein
MIRILALTFLLFAATSPAAAHHRHARAPGFAVLIHHHKHHGHSQTSPQGRPAAWCGWFMRHLVGNDPGSAFNLARNWAHWGSPSNVTPGAVVVYRHHVVKVIEVLPGNRILAISGNDGHAVRTRPRSLAGAIAVRS